MSEAQWAEASERLDNHAARFAGIESRLDRVERVVRETARVVVIRKVCPEYHAPIGPNETCVDVRTIEARSK